MKPHKNHTAQASKQATKPIFKFKLNEAAKGTRSGGGIAFT